MITGKDGSQGQRPKGTGPVAHCLEGADLISTVCPPILEQNCSNACPLESWKFKSFKIHSTNISGMPAIVGGGLCPGHCGYRGKLEPPVAITSQPKVSWLVFLNLHFYRLISVSLSQASVPSPEHILPGRRNPGPWSTSGLISNQYSSPDVFPNFQTYLSSAWMPQLPPHMPEAEPGISLFLGGPRLSLPAFRQMAPAYAHFPSQTCGNLP